MNEISIKRTIFLTLATVVVWIGRAPQSYGFFPSDQAGPATGREETTHSGMSVLPNTFFADEEPESSRKSNRNSSQLPDPDWTEELEGAPAQRPATKQYEIQSSDIEHLLESTGVVVDARSLNFHRAIFPRLVTVDTNYIVYSAKTVDSSIKEGALYTSDPKRVAQQRLSINRKTEPHMLTPLRVAKNGRDFLISEADGQKLIQLDRQTKVLQAGNVVIWTN